MSIGIDVGGTFTDFVVIESEQITHTFKLLSSPPDFSSTMVEGIRSFLESHDVDPRQVAELRHGTTVATNAILENRGARTALVTTRGFRDVLELARMRHPSLYDTSWSKPRPLVPRRWRFEVDLRIAADGEVIETPTKEALDKLVEELEQARPEAIAVSLINSYRAPESERALAGELRERCSCGYVCASVDILPEMKEYERTSTAVVNAVVGPVVDDYLRRVVDRLAAIGVRAPLAVMQSSGGLLDAGTARRQPVRLIESGPAAGVSAARRLARELSLPDVVSFDMGGTTAKVALIERGRCFEAREYEVGGGMNARHVLGQGGGYVIRVPSIDVAEIGTGGGSICWIDDGGCPRVGPRSAGALPGPACYGNGGTEPTLTDALVVLGYLSPDSIAGGTQILHADLARQAFGGGTARALRTDEVGAAYGFYEIAVAAMANAVKAVTSQRGRDPRHSALVAFGGAGPAYCAEIARRLRIAHVVVPADCGVFSAVGLLEADVHYDAVHSLRSGGPPREDVMEACFCDMERELALRVERAGRDDPTFERSADVRYVGQSYELSVPLPRPASPGGGASGAEGMLAQIRDAFEAEHLASYGHRDAGQQIEVLSLRVRATLPGNVAGSRRAGRRHGGEPAAAAPRLADFGPAHGRRLTPIAVRSELSESPVRGPLIVQDPDATVVVPPRATASLDAFGNIHLQVEP